MSSEGLVNVIPSLSSHNIEAEGKRIKTAGNGYIGVTPVELATSTGICSTRQVAGYEAGTQGAHF
jgi:hypothetical protein